MRHLQHEIEDAEGVSIVRTLTYPRPRRMPRTHARMQVPQREQFEQRKSMGKPRKDTRDLRAKH